VFLCCNGHPEDGTPVSKHAGFDTLNYILRFVCFLLGNSPASEFYIPKFRNTLFHLHRQVGMKNNNSV
jgi:hypothetical protein